MVKLINLLEVSSSEFRTKLKTLGHTEKGSELTSGGELNPKFLDILTPFLDEWTKMGGNTCKLEFTGGNDKFHQDRDSKHKVGDAVDVTLPTSCHAKFTELLNSYVKKYPGFTYIDEYKKLSKGATGKHFHISIGGANTQTTTSGSTPTNTTQSDGKELIAALFQPFNQLGITGENVKSNNQILTEDFVNPQPDPNSSTIVSPYDGDVIETDPSVCNGKIRIKHNINGLFYYTEFCNVNRIKVRNGEFIRKNETVGDLGDNSLKVYVYDNTGRKHSVSEFIKTSNEKTIDPKKEKKVEKDSNYNYYNDNPRKDKYPGILTLPINMALAPLSIFNDMMSYKGKKKKVEEDEKINEEINRIKELLK